MGGLLAPGGAAAKPPKGFLGMNVNGPLDDPAFDLAGEAKQMRSIGVRSWRVEFSWDLIEPKPGEFAWAATDRKVLAAAQAGIDVLGLAVRAPFWANGSFFDPFVPPKDPEAYGRFTAALVRRYGPDGTLWKENSGVRKRPVRDWEIWNEPNLAVYFRDQPFEKPYAKLLRAAYKSIKTVDRRSTVVLAGMANFSWRDLNKLLKKERGLRFDAAAVHPFTGKPSGMIEITRRNRQVLDRRGRRSKPLWLTEMTWSSAKGKKTPLTKGWETTESGQARRLTQAYQQLARYRKRLKVSNVFWYTWASRDDGSPNSFEYSGLRTTRGEGSGELRNKPALSAFRRIAK
ncbi:MAG: beta-galactosidase [Solirubrobacterales bacterium]|nr:beta-galactosidase [Solirubrobacterales bacterium]